MIRETVAFGLVMLVCLAIVAHCTGCVSREAKEAAADSAYAAEHLRCVDKYETKREIDACRSAVRIRWGIAEAVHDAGADK